MLETNFIYIQMLGTRSKASEMVENRSIENLEEAVLIKLNCFLFQFWKGKPRFQFEFEDNFIVIKGSSIGRIKWENLVQAVNAFSKAYDETSEIVFKELYKPFSDLRCNSLEELAVNLDLKYNCH